jgi:TonB family protein
VNPVYPNQLAKGGGGRVSVGFYIDEQGRVRMPSVSIETNEANEELAAAAVTAVSQWQFETPTCKSRPVLVLAQQEFSFKPKAQ